MKTRMTGPTVRRPSLPLTERDEQELTLLRESPIHRSMLAELSAGSTFPKDVSEAVMLHTVFEIGLRTVREALEEKGYAELAKAQAEEEPNKYVTARRYRPTWADEE
jgi:hypothetical protein